MEGSEGACDHLVVELSGAEHLASSSALLDSEGDAAAESDELQAGADDALLMVEGWLNAHLHRAKGAASGEPPRPPLRDATEAGVRAPRRSDELRRGAGADS